MKTRDFSQSRSDKYQLNIVETCIDYKIFSHLPNEDKLFYSNPIFADDRENKINRLEEVTTQLANKIYSVAKEVLTEKQYKVFHLLYKEDMSQTDVGKLLKQNQSSIHHTLNGNFSRTGVYGGCKKKILKAIKDDQEVKALLQEIAELKDAIYA